MNSKVTIYTDGSCHGNPGPGGYAAVVFQDGVVREVHGSNWHTTNNRMELTAVVKGLQLLSDPCEVCIISDSKYVVNPIQKGNLWEYINTRCRTNVDLWERVLKLSAFHTLTAKWVKGHAGDRYNKRCDTLANKEAANVKKETDIRMLVFRELFANVCLTPERIANKGGIENLETIRKYYKQYFECYDRSQ